MAARAHNECPKKAKAVEEILARLDPTGQASRHEKSPSTPSASDGRLHSERAPGPRSNKSAKPVPYGHDFTDPVSHAVADLHELSDAFAHDDAEPFSVAFGPACDD